MKLAIAALFSLFGLLFAAADGYTFLRLDAERFQVFGYEPMPLLPAQISRLIESDSRRFGEVIKRLNISLD